MSTLRLLCIPHAGGSAVVYRRWDGRMPAGVEITPLQPAGRGTRLRERPHDDLDAAVADLRRQAQADVGPYVVFGHSLGALLAFELARAQAADGGRPPLALVVGGRNAPGTPAMHPPVHALDHDAFIEALRVFGGTPPQVLENPELLEIFLPALRADLRIAETYRRRPGPPLDCPIAVLGGRDDPLTRPADLFAWQAETTAEVDLTLLPGEHFLLEDDRFVRAVAARVDRLD